MKKFRKWLLKDRFSPFKSVSRLIGVWFNDHFTANQVTLFGVLIAVPMCFFFLFDEMLIGGIFLAISLSTDFIDGALARYQQGDAPVMLLSKEVDMSMIARINYRGVTHLGRSFDPLADKIRFFLVLYPLGWGIVNYSLIIVITLIALALTVIRPLKQSMGLDHVGSNRFGKFKMLAEMMGMILLVFIPDPLLLSGAFRLIIHAVFVTALLFSLLSLSGHLYTGTFTQLLKLSRRKSRFSCKDDLDSEIKVNSLKKITKTSGGNTSEIP